MWGVEGMKYRRHEDFSPSTSILESQMKRFQFGRDAEAIGMTQAFPSPYLWSQTSGKGPLRIQTTISVMEGRMESPIDRLYHRPGA